MIDNKSIMLITILSIVTAIGCGKDDADPSPPPPPLLNFNLKAWSVNNSVSQAINYNVNRTPVVQLDFGAAINKSTVAANISFKENNGTPVNYNITYTKGDSTVLLQPANALDFLTKYKVSLTGQLKSTAGGTLSSSSEIAVITVIDSSRKFPVVSDAELFDTVQRRTFNYFWKLAHPASGMIRERNTDANIYTSGGTGFGIMSIIVAIHRNFITKAEGLARLQTMVSFLKNTAETFHGAYPHWLNGQTGKVIAFSANDDGADIVETSYLVQGLLTARQFFDGTGAEADLRNDINTIVNRVEWDWFRKNNENVLYWHWSGKNTNGWIMNMQVKGWNECLITYVLAASSTTHSIPKPVYDNGWASNGAMKNGKSYYGFQLPLGPEQGGPLFFSHYSFLGIRPANLSDTYANYQTQVTNHSLINYNYCKTNPKNFFGYSDSVWGLTASDIKDGYNANSPTSDLGFISPTAALSSFPYTPQQSMQALKFFYYVLGDKIWKEYGFADAFSLHEPWFADSFLAIDQGPIIIMIENHRSNLLWDLFTSCPEVKAGMKALGFSAPYL
jgi:hypothetical protein